MILPSWSASVGIISTASCSSGSKSAPIDAIGSTPTSINAPFKAAGRADHSVSKMLDRRVGLARRDGKIQIVQNRKQRRKKIELRLLAAILERFH